MNLEKVVFDYLENKVTKDRLQESLEALENKQPTNERSDKSYWYANSYKPFIEYYKNNNRSKDINTWAIKVSMVYSWIASIPPANFSVIEELVSLQEVYGEVKLWEVGVKSYIVKQGDTHRSQHNGEDIFCVNGEVALIRDFLEPVNTLLNNSQNWATTISTTSKLLHFTYPDLFPIFDKVVCVNVFGSEIRNYNRYYSYIWGIRNFIKENKWIVDLGDSSGYSPLKLIDLVIFN